MVIKKEIRTIATVSVLDVLRDMIKYLEER